MLGGPKCTSPSIYIYNYIMYGIQNLVAKKAKF